ncbi:lipocalin family protein [Acidiphilium sp.]|uniref:lipocalin family protein n=1 Tax=Acidiphilium sp. TaxID=527 RepID=UPI003D00FB6F
MLTLARRSFLAAAPAALAGCTLDTSSYPFPPLHHATLDLDRFMGRYYIIGHIPYFAEANYVGSYAVYTRRADGTINDQYNGYPKRFSAPLFQFTSIDYVEPDSGNAIWRVTALNGWIGVPYVIMHVEPDDSAFMGGFPNRTLGWIFSRTKHMDPSLYQAMLERFYHQGYDARQFRRVAQFPSQIGQPGFERIT